MNKIPLSGFCLSLKSRHKHLFRIMRITYMLLFAVILCLQAENAMSQKITLQGENLSVKDYLNTIEKQSDYLFIYDAGVNVNRKVSLNLTNRSIKEVLNNLVSQLDLSYALEGSYIILSSASKKETAGILAAQQKKSVTGMVTDKNGEPIIGANVVEKGTTNGIITDVDGKFSLNIAPGAVLQISYIGYNTQEIKVSGRNVINVTLMENTQDLDEVIVVAYGSMKKSSYTGSASVIKTEQLEKFSGTGFTDALQGLSAGVNVTSDASNPGAEARIAIRGITNMSGTTTPLYVVDGIPYDGALNSINPNDIESLTVLKDAAASSLYGSRAANGVVIITTKTGKEGAPKITVNAGWGTSDNAVGYGKKADPRQTLLLYWEGLYNDAYYYTGGYSKQEAAKYADERLMGKIFHSKVTDSKGNSIYVSPFRHIDENWVLNDGNGNPSINPNLEYAWKESDWDWFGTYYSRKLRQNYSVDLSGATANGKTNYYTSIGYLDDNGYGGKDYYKRYSFNANVNSEINKWLSMGGNVRYSYSRQNSNGQTRALNYTSTLSSPYLRNTDNTDWVVSEKTGERIYQYGKYTTGYFGSHPFGSLGDYWDNDNDESFNSSDGTEINASYYAQITLPYDLKIKSVVNVGDNTSRSYGYSSAVWGSQQSEPYGFTILPAGGSATRSTYQVLSVTNSNTLNWNKDFNKHHLNLLLGQEVYSYRTQYTYGYGEGIYQLGQFEIASASDYFQASSYSDRYALMSWIGKADYSFDDRYYGSVSYRRDGSSRFSPQNRWGNFWSVGGSWRLSKEKFLEDADWIDNLSLRASYGTSGNDRLISRQSNGKAGSEYLYAYQAVYGNDNVWNQAGLKPITNAAPDLHWEKNKQWNVATDFSLFGWLNGTFEYYTRGSDGLLYFLDFPLSAQVGDVKGRNVNLGNIRNSGVELTLGFSIFNTKKFQWRIDANMSTLKNEVTYLPTKVGFWSNVVAYYKLEEGGSLYDFWAPRFAGIDADTGYATYYKADGSIVNSTSALVREEDYVKVGSALPKAYGAVTNSLAFKNFDLSFMFYYSLGGKMYCYNKSELASIGSGKSPVWDLVKDRWSEPGDTSAELPVNFFDNRSKASIGYSDCYILNNNYLRLRNLTIGYSIPKSVLTKIGIERARVYFSGDNLLTFGEATKYYTDPETGISGNTYNGNSDSEGYGGGRRLYMFGVNVVF